MSRSVWAAPFAVEIDGLRIGIRADGDESNRWLAGLLGDYVVDDPDVPANYSVRLGAELGDLNLLYWGGCLVARSRDESDLVAAIASHLGGHGPPPNGVVRLAGSVVHDGTSGVVLASVDHVLASKVAVRLRDRAFMVGVSPWVDVDVAGSRIRRQSSLQLGGGSARSVPESLELVTVGIPATNRRSRSLSDRVVALLHQNVLRGDDTDLNAAVELLKSSRIAEISAYAVSDLAWFVRNATGMSG